MSNVYMRHGLGDLLCLMSIRDMDPVTGAPRRPDPCLFFQAGDDGAVRVRWSCGQGGRSGVEYIVLKQVTLAETLR